MANNFLRSTLLWSILAAAFIGPGTVTTAAKAGANFGLTLLWALIFSVIATMVLQEMAARLTLASGKNLGQIIGTGPGAARQLAYLIFFAIALGCGAYQAGNLLGALAGIQLLGDLHRVWVLLLGSLAAIILWSGNIKLITRLLAGIVAIMGIVFIWAATQAEVSLIEWWKGLNPMGINDESALLVIALIGTTIVPYNLFLAAGISKDQSVTDMRKGLLTSIFIGGGITLAILLTGTQVSGEFSFKTLADTLEKSIGSIGPYLLGFGLAAAGLSSAITAPLAAAITGQSLFGQNANWKGNSKNFRLTWSIILLAGLGFALLDIKPIPAIIAAQAINGFILPLVAIFLLLGINNKRLIIEANHNPSWLNILACLIVGVTIFLGLHNLWSAFAKPFPGLTESVSLSTRILINTGIAIVVLLWLARRVFLKSNLS